MAIILVVDDELGIRGLLDVIPLDATLVKGSHGRDRVPDDARPVLLGTHFPVRSAEDVHQAHRCGEVKHRGEQDQLHATHREQLVEGGAGRHGQHAPDDAHADQQHRQAGEHQRGMPDRQPGDSGGHGSQGTRTGIG